MNGKDMRRLSKTDLLEMLVEQARVNVELRTRLEKAEAELAERRLQQAECGSIAEAALKLSGVFEAAQKAIDLYRANVERECEEMKEKARREATGGADPANTEGKEESPE